MAHDSAGLGITIAGMHRSGTSALAGTLSLLGAQAPKTLFSDHWNPKGHFESIPVIDISNETLQSLGLEVEDWGALPPNGLSPHDITKLTGQFASAIRSEFSRNLIVVKDPRFCRFPELIAAGLNQAGWQPAFVLIYRNPFEVAMSLERRNGLPLDYNLLIWLRSLLDAERGTRGFPRAFLSYENLIANWRGAVDKLQRKLGLVFPRRSTRAEAEVDRFLEADLRHFKLSSRPSGTAFEEWLVRTWDAYVALDDDADSKTAQAALDEVNAAFTTSSNKLHGLVCLLTADKPPKPAEPATEEIKQAVTTALADSQQQNQQLITQISTLMAEQAEALNTARLTSGQMAEHVSQTIGKLFVDTQQHNQQLLTQVSALVAEQTESLGAVRLADVQMAEHVSQTVGKLFVDTQQHNQQFLAQVSALVAEQTESLGAVRLADAQIAEQVNQTVGKLFVDTQQHNQQLLTQVSALVAEQTESLGAVRLADAQMAEQVNQTVGKLFVDTQQLNQQLLTQVSALVAEQTESLGAVRLADAQMAEQVNQTVVKLFADTQQLNQHLLAQVSALVAEQTESLGAVRLADAQMAEQVNQTVGKLFVDTQQLNQHLLTQVSALVAEQTESLDAVRLNDVQMAEQVSQTISKLSVDTQQHNQQLLAQVTAMAAEQANVVREAAQTLSQVPAQISAEHTLRVRMQEALFDEKLARLQERLSARENALAASIERAARAEAAAEQAHKREVDQIANIRAEADARINQIEADADSMVVLAHNRAEKAEIDAASMVAAIRNQSAQAIAALHNQIKNQSQQLEAAKNQKLTLISLFDAQVAEITHANEQSHRFSREITSRRLLLRLILRQWPKRQKILQPIIEQYPLSPEQQNILMHWVGRRRILFGLLRRSRAARSALVQVQTMSLCTAAQQTSWQCLKDGLHESSNEDRQY